MSLVNIFLNKIILLQFYANLLSNKIARKIFSKIKFQGLNFHKELIKKIIYDFDSKNNDFLFSQ